jgi:hypothetical protein
MQAGHRRACSSTSSSSSERSKPEQSVNNAASSEAVAKQLMSVNDGAATTPQAAQLSLAAAAQSQLVQWQKWLSVVQDGMSIVVKTPSRITGDTSSLSSYTVLQKGQAFVL